MAVTLQTVSLHRWTREQYENMVLAGIFHPEDRVELINGEILNMAPQSSSHSVAIRLTEDALRLAFGRGHDVRVQMPLALDDNSEPEPDIAVVTGSPRDYLQGHPKTAVLIVEVADTTLALDRSIKKALYARNGIQDYWIVNLRNACLEVYRLPDRQAESYSSQSVLRRGDVVQPVACPNCSIQVADLLP